MHIHPSSPNSSSPMSGTSAQSEEDAAIKIQAGFRGYRVRKQIHPQQGRSTANHNSAPKSSSLNGSATPLCDERNSNSDSASVEDRCATKIQAGVRGFLVRKKQKIATDAATKIQAGFRGFKVRKETQKLKQK